MDEEKKKEAQLLEIRTKRALIPTCSHAEATASRSSLSWRLIYHSTNKNKQMILFVAYKQTATFSTHMLSLFSRKAGLDLQHQMTSSQYIIAYAQWTKHTVN